MFLGHYNNNTKIRVSWIFEQQHEDTCFLDIIITTRRYVFCGYLNNNTKIHVSWTFQQQHKDREITQIKHFYFK